MLGFHVVAAVDGTTCQCTRCRRRVTGTPTRAARVTVGLFSIHIIILRTAIAPAVIAGKMRTRMSS